MYVIKLNKPQSRPAATCEMQPNILWHELEPGAYHRKTQKVRTAELQWNPGLPAVAATGTVGNWPSTIAMSVKIFENHRVSCDTPYQQAIWISQNYIAYCAQEHEADNGTKRWLDTH